LLYNLNFISLLAVIFHRPYLTPQLNPSKMMHMTTNAGTGEKPSYTNDGMYAVRNIHVHADAQTLFHWLSLDDSKKLPPTFTAAVTQEYNRLVKTKGFQGYMVTHTGNEILLVETYHSATPGIFPTGLDTETNDLLIKIYCNPYATPALQKGSLAYLLDVLHKTGSNGIWMEMEPGTQEHNAALLCGFSPIGLYDMLLHHV
jgi:hypothetical protein